MPEGISPYAPQGGHFSDNRFDENGEPYLEGTTISKLAAASVKFVASFKRGDQATRESTPPSSEQLQALQNHFTHE